MKNNLYNFILFAAMLVCVTLSVVINNLLISKCGIFLSWWAGAMVSMLIWAGLYSILEKKYSKSNS